MPIYEFHCPRCGGKVSILVKSVGASSTRQCPACGNNDLKRLITAFTYHRPAESVREFSGEPDTSLGPEYYRDPRHIGRWVENKFKRMEADLPGQIKEQIRAAREGELPDSLKEAL